MGFPFIDTLRALLFGLLLEGVCICELFIDWFLEIVSASFRVWA